MILAGAVHPAVRTILADPLVTELLISGGQVLAMKMGSVAELVGRVGGRRPLLVLDPGVARATDASERLRAGLSGLQMCEFDDIRPNPRDAECMGAALAGERHRADVVVALGGGSTLDVAKLAALGPTAAEAAMEAHGRIANAANVLPIIAIPTTSGTGAESTPFAAVYVRGRKVSIDAPSLRPRGVVLDVRLHMAMPATVAACSGLDALAQAAESTWAIRGTMESLRFSEAALTIMRGKLVSSVRACDEGARAGMMMGAHLAGRAIAISRTTAAHALSYELTQRFGLAHGHAVALTLGHLAAANERVSEVDCADPRGPGHVRASTRDVAGAFGVMPQGMPGTMRGLLRELGLAATLREAGVPLDALASLAESMDPVRSGNNPRRLGRSQVEALLREAFGGEDEGPASGSVMVPPQRAQESPT